MYIPHAGDVGKHNRAVVTRESWFVAKQPDLEFTLFVRAALPLTPTAGQLHLITVIPRYSSLTQSKSTLAK